MRDKPWTFAFDMVGTVMNFDAVPREEIQEYGAQLREFHQTKNWRPLSLPKSWYDLEPHPDAKDGLAQLSADGYRTLTCSNMPWELQNHWANEHGLCFDGIVPLEAIPAYKTDPSTYALVCSLWRLRPSEVVFVTANASFGDLEASEAMGMLPLLISRNGYIESSYPQFPTMHNLATRLI